MADEPTGRYALKLKGKPLSARTFHLYKDCGHIIAFGTSGEEGDIIEPSDEIVEMMEMRVCTQCDTRSKQVEAEDAILATLNDLVGATVEGNGEVVTAIMEALEVNGFVIRRVRKNAAPAPIS